MLMNPIAREIVIDGDDCVEHTASPFFLPHSSHATYFSITSLLSLLFIGGHFYFAKTGHCYIAFTTLLRRSGGYVKLRLSGVL